MSQESYRNPTPTVDVIIETEGGVVLIERANAPHGWALPGGFVDEGECVERAALREALEETSLQVELTDLLYVYSDPSRDPRLHTMSPAFVARVTGGSLCASDDAKQARVFALDALPQPICFDHAEILEDYMRFKRTGERPAPMDKLAAASS